jgi:hypothetical protein
MQIRKILAVAAVAFAAMALHADDRFDKTFSRTVAYHGGGVTIDHRYGSVRVRAVHDNEVSVRAVIRASDADYGKQINVTVSESGSGVEVKTSYPEKSFHYSFNGEFSYSVELEVNVPENAPLTVRNRFGSIDVTGTKASSEIVGGQGAVSVHNVRGTQRIQNSFGSVELVSADGDVTVTNTNGSVKALHVRGSVSLTSRFGSIAVDDVSGDAEVHGGNGSVDVQSVRGRATVNNSFDTTTVHDVGRDFVFTGNNSRVEAGNIGAAANITTTFDSVTVSNAGGNVTVKDSNGNVSVVDAKADVTIDNRFGSVRAERVRGSADVDNANGSVSVGEIGGNVKIHTTFASAFVKGAGGSVDVQNQNGAVSVSGLRAPCHAVTLNTTFSSIKVVLPDNAGYDVNARTTFGHIATEVPITTSHLGEDMLTGRIGNGGCKLELKTANGGITIAKD